MSLLLRGTSDHFQWYALGIVWTHSIQYLLFVHRQSPEPNFVNFNENLFFLSEYTERIGYAERLGLHAKYYCNQWVGDSFPVDWVDVGLLTN